MVTLQGVFHLRRLTIARYSAVISSGLREVTRRGRGGIAGRWTKPAAASPVATSRRKPSRHRGPDVGDSYPGSTDAASLDSTRGKEPEAATRYAGKGPAWTASGAPLGNTPRATRFPSDVLSSSPRLPFAGRNSVASRFPLPTRWRRGRRTGAWRRARPGGIRRFLA